MNHGNAMIALAVQYQIGLFKVSMIFNFWNYCLWISLSFKKGKRGGKVKEKERRSRRWWRNGVEGIGMEGIVGGNVALVGDMMGSGEWMRHSQPDDMGWNSAEVYHELSFPPLDLSSSQSGLQTSLPVPLQTIWAKPLPSRGNSHLMMTIPGKTMKKEIPISAPCSTSKIHPPMNYPNQT